MLLEPEISGKKRKALTQKKLKHHGEKIKQVRLHSKEPWLLAAQYNGTAQIFNYETQVPERVLEISKEHLRCCAFIEERNWALFGGDDNKIRGFNYHTQEKVFEALEHKDFVRDMLPLSSLGKLVSCSDDKNIIVWKVGTSIFLILVIIPVRQSRQICVICFVFLAFCDP